MIDPRQTLDALIRDRKESYASVSRLLGRNPAYIQQYVQRGSPKRLDDDDIVQLALHFGVKEADLGGLEELPVDQCATIELPILNPIDGGAKSRAYDEAALRQLTRKPTGLAVVFTEGDAMRPTLSHGDELLIQRHSEKFGLRDGLYALRAEGNVLVRRVAVEPRRNLISVLSDNPHYPRWESIPARSIHILGRVVWIGHRTP